MPGLPVAGSRVNATPVPESNPLFPKTIVWTFTAVPSASSIFSRRRYSCARRLFHELKTASIAIRSCCRGSCGNDAFPSRCTIALNSSTRWRRSSAARSVSLISSRCFSRAFALRVFASSSASSKISPEIPMTIFPNIWTKRR
jgi:hypothetical protein